MRRKRTPIFAALAFVIAIALFLVIAGNAFGQQVQELQFVDQPISDIIIALGELYGKSIIPDDTVQGKATYYIVEADFDAALAVFLEANHLYVREDDGRYFISRIQVEFDDLSKTVTMDADEVLIRYLVRALSEEIGQTILYDSLPSDTLTIHVNRVEPVNIIEIFIKKYPDLDLVVDENYYYIKRVPASPATTASSRGQPLVSEQAGKYSVHVDRERFAEIINNLFSTAGIEFSMLTNRDAIMENVHFEDKEFGELLRLILEQASADYAVQSDIYYIFDVTEKDVLKKLKNTVTLPLQYLSVQDLPNLLPPDLLSTRLYKMDSINNAVILNGSIEEIAPVQAFIREIDRPLSNQQYHRFDLNFIKVEEIQKILPDSLKYVAVKPIPGANSFVALLSRERSATLSEFLSLVDQPGELATIHLRYIKAEDLLAQLPPSIAQEDIVVTADPTTVFVRGTPEKIDAVYRELEILDRPSPQLTYHILVVQYSEGEGLNWDVALDTTLTQENDTTALLGTIGKLLSLNFDIVSAFGYLFAIDLSLDMSANDAHVLADTTLHGVSGQEIKFQNTETYRYREIEIDSEGNPSNTGVTREISAGLIFGITGWVSGEGVVTMEINATVSKRGSDLSSTTTSLPPTSENVITTQVRTRVGEPVVIGGLVRQEKGTSVSKVPLLGDIPLLGLLFQSRKDTVENSELAIYILPHIDYGLGVEEGVEMQLERLYDRFGEHNRL